MLWTQHCLDNRLTDGEENILIDDRCQEVFLQLKYHFLFSGFLSIKVPCVRTFFTNLEIVSPDGHVVSANLSRNFLLHNLYEFLSHNNYKRKLLVLNCISHEP
jgi:hypothetical protein